LAKTIPIRIKDSVADASPIALQRAGIARHGEVAWQASATALGLQWPQWHDSYAQLQSTGSWTLRLIPASLPPIEDITIVMPPRKRIVSFETKHPHCVNSQTSAAINPHSATKQSCTTIKKSPKLPNKRHLYHGV
jgi:hypothetical protein